jgi:hypothetical protein
VGLRATKVGLRVLRDGPSTTKMRATKAGLRVLHNGPSTTRMRATQAALRVLRTSASLRAVGATTTINLASVASQIRHLRPTATTTINLASVGIGKRDVHVASTTSINLQSHVVAEHWIFVAATNNLDFLSVGGQRRSFLASAASTFNLNSSASKSIGIFHAVAAATTINLASSSSELASFKRLATTTINLQSVASPRGVYFRSAQTTINLASGVQTIGVFRRAASSSFNFRSQAAVIQAGQKYVDASSTLIFTEQATAHDTNIRVSGSSTFKLASVASEHSLRIWHLTASSGIDLASVAGELKVGPIRVFASSSMDFESVADEGSRRTWRVAGSSNIDFASVAAERRLAVARGSSTIALIGAARQVRDIHVAAISSMGMASSTGANKRYFVSASGSIGLASSATATKGSRMAQSTVTFTDRADAVVWLPPAGGVPGGETAGMRERLMSGVSGDWPFSYAETPSGLVLIANGVDPMIRWDGLAGAADTAGIKGPAAAIAFGGVGVGTIVGRRVAFCRFLDAKGNPSNLSPVSNEVDFGRDGLIEQITYDRATGKVTVRSEGHGRATGDPLIVSGVEGLEICNGVHTIAVVDADRFTLNGVVCTSGTWTQGGVWTYGIATVSYSAVPVPAEAKVVRRQILRNLAGNAEAFYVDIDTTDLTSTTILSSSDDETLAANESVPLAFSDGIPLANRYGVPPSHKLSVLSHLGYIFAAGDVTYSEGHIEPVYNSAVVKGVGTNLRGTFAKRVLYVEGAGKPYEIASVDEANQTMTLTAPFSDVVPKFPRYAIRSAPGERRLVYYCEPGRWEAWPEWSALALPEDGDDIIGQMVKDSFVFVLENRNIWKITIQADPARDGFSFNQTARGCVNNRCHVQVEGHAYMLDEYGIHKFDGGKSVPISTPIQPIFQQGIAGTSVQVNWSADKRLWHAAHDPVREVIRWFVAMSGHRQPRHAICYEYRLDRWWIEEYPYPITSSAVGLLGYRRSMAGSVARRVLVLAEGTTDAVSEGNAFRGTVTSSGPLSLTDSSASFPAGLAGAPVAIAEGPGVGQWRRIVANDTTTIQIDRPWTIRPSAESLYQVGGVSWRWKSGWFRYSDDEAGNPRDVEVVYQPLSAGSMGLELFFNHSDKPRAWAYAKSDDGVTYTQGQPRIVVSMDTDDGYAIHRAEGHREVYARGDRFVAVKLSGVQAGEVVRVYQVTLNGVRG